MKKIAISQSNYIPWKGYFGMIDAVDEFVIYDEVQFTKRDWRNRNRIITKHGLIWLTVPVVQEDVLKKCISEIKIDYQQSWQKKHKQTIEHNYSKAPFFKDYYSYIEPYYNECKFEYLSDLNESLLKTICSILGINTKITRSSCYEGDGDKNERLINICRYLDCGIYFTGPAAKSYLDITKFETSALKIHWIDYSHYKEYKQLSDYFSHQVSVLDLIFNVGAEAQNLMKLDQS